ncbi:MAG TPA: hypothetical protein PLF01_04000, partial [Alphaproteobacteria bacterium]|nr:hypothetical protein [Alphaproteobacteria bacterium]
MDNSLALNDRRSGGERRNSDGTARFVESTVTTIATELAKRMKPKPLKPVEQKFLDLMEGRRAGHMGDDEYANGGMKEWDRFLTEHPEYYVPMEEQALIERCASASARLLDKNQKITLVSRGPGTKFAAKEGALIRAFRAAGIEVAKV